MKTITVKVKTKELEARIVELEELVQNVNDEVDALCGNTERIDEIISYWNAHHPTDMIFSSTTNNKKQYAMSDEAWKKATHMPHPRDKVRKFNPSTGEVE